MDKYGQRRVPPPPPKVICGGGLPNYSKQLLDVVAKYSFMLTPRKCLKRGHQGYKGMGGGSHPGHLYREPTLGCILSKIIWNL